MKLVFLKIFGAIQDTSGRYDVTGCIATAHINSFLFLVVGLGIICSGENGIVLAQRMISGSLPFPREYMNV